MNASRGNDSRQSLLSLHEGQQNLSTLRRADRWLRQRSLFLIALTMITAFSWPEYAARIFAANRTLQVPLVQRGLDIQTLALAFIILAASIRCIPADYTRAFRSRAGVTSLFTIYVAVPVIVTAVALATFQIAGGGELRGIGLGLLLIAAMPVATTAAVWTRASQGSVPVSLGAIAVTSLLAVFVVPPVLTRAGAFSGANVGASFEALRVEVVVAFAIPLLVGTAIRKLGPAVARAIEPILSMVSMLVVLAFIADTAGALRPQLEAHQAVIAIAIPVTVVTNVLALGVGYFVSRFRGLSDEETIAVVFGSSMRSVPSALAIAALCFPSSPIVALPAILWSVTQQLLGGFITGRIVRARELAEPVIPLKRPFIAATELAARISKPALAELEETIVRPFAHTRRHRLPSHPR